MDNGNHRNYDDKSVIMSKRRRIYYPKGSIQSGLYTEGGQLMSEDGVEYFGQYHIYKNTKEIFSEPEFIKGKSVKLIPFVDLSQQDLNSNFQYNKLKEVEDYQYAISTPDPILVSPTNDDYDRGFVVRYLLKRYGSGYIFDVSEAGFGFDNPYFQKLEIKWKISGPLNDENGVAGIIDTNLRTINLYKNDFEGLESYLSNLTEFSKV